MQVEARINNVKLTASIVDLNMFIKNSSMCHTKIILGNEINQTPIHSWKTRKKNKSAARENIYNSWLYLMALMSKQLK